MSGSDAGADDDSRQLTAFLEASPDVEIVEAILPDLNGRLRGKWVARRSIENAFHGGLKLPLSTLAFDVWGRDPEDWVFESGDGDGICRPDVRTLRTVPWLRHPTAQMLMSLDERAGVPCAYDPRELLRCLARRLEGDHGLLPVVASEMEFGLFHAECDALGRPRHTQTGPAGEPAIGGQTYGIDAMQDAAEFMHSVRAACTVQNLPADTLIAEAGPSQFEINLFHQADALLAADQAVLLQRAIKGVAASQGLRASFMAKPFIDSPGNGLHVHCSLLDADRANAFDDGSERGSDLLRFAIGGCIASMADCMLLFAPHRNSYRRFRRGSHAPLAPAWGYDNRTVALRVPAGPSHALRIEHRVAGADANPYLVIAAMLAGILYGIEERPVAPEPVHGDAYNQCKRSLPATWRDALTAFSTSGFVRDYLGGDFQAVYAGIKQQEIDEFDRHVSPLEYATCL